MLRRQAIFDAELLDKYFFMYYEAMDLCCRFKQLGWKIVYFDDASVSQNPRRMRLELYKLVVFFDKHYGPATLARMRFCLLVKTGKDYLFGRIPWELKGGNDSKTKNKAESVGDILSLIRSYS